MRVVNVSDATTANVWWYAGSNMEISGIGDVSLVGYMFVQGSIYIKNTASIGPCYSKNQLSLTGSGITVNSAALIRGVADSPTISPVQSVMPQQTVDLKSAGYFALLTPVIAVVQNNNIIRGE